MRSQRVRIQTRTRRGTTAVETAVVLPIFVTFLFGLFEFGRMAMIDANLDNACRQASRYGATEGVSTQNAVSSVREFLDANFDVDSEQFVVQVKDASVFDQGGSVPLSGEDIDEMPDLELSSADARQLFCVHASVPYNSVALIPWPFTNGIVLSGTAYIRHE